MNPKDDGRAHPFRDSTQDAAAAERLPDTAQTRAPAYRLAFTDTDFLMREELRPVRLQLELLKPQMVLDERGIRSTVVVMGSARVRPDGAGPAGAGRGGYPARGQRRFWPISMIANWWGASMSGACCRSRCSMAGGASGQWPMSRTAPPRSMPAA